MWSPTARPCNLTKLTAQAAGPPANPASKPAHLHNAARGGHEARDGDVARRARRVWVCVAVVCIRGLGGQKRAAKWAQGGGQGGPPDAVARGIKPYQCGRKRLRSAQAVHSAPHAHSTPHAHSHAVHGHHAQTYAHGQPQAQAQAGPHALPCACTCVAVAHAELSREPLLVLGSGIPRIVPAARQHAPHKVRCADALGALDLQQGGAGRRGWGREGGEVRGRLSWQRQQERSDGGGRA